MPAQDRQTVEIDGRRLTVTNLDKVMYPEVGMTKGEVIAYYSAVAPVMLPHLAGRPVTRKRWVQGVETDASAHVFFEKNLAEHAPAWIRREVIHHSDGPKTYPVIEERAALVWLAQQAALELHVPQWQFVNGVAANPDRMVFDLDPGPGVGLAECAIVARMVRDLVSGMGLSAQPVTSGSKGLHIYARIDGSQSSDQVSAVARELAKALEVDHPGLVVSSMSKAVRDGRVFIDWSQNNGKKTTIAPYSLRGRARPFVAAPRTWDELDDPELRHLEAHEVLARLSSLGDPLAALLAEPAQPVGGTRGRVAAALPGSASPPSAAREAEGPLATYLSMRSAATTPEPMPQSAWAAPSGHQRFVIQEHHARRLHYDLRLEHDGVLKSWAVPKGIPDASSNHLAVQTEDHPIDYLTFAGDIPAGEYGAGTMTIWDTGTYELEKWRDDELILTLTGSDDGPLGVARLALIRTSGAGEKSQWLLHRMKGAAAGARPTLAPMLATVGRVAPVRSADWLLEWKWDGVRAIVRIADGMVTIRSRNGNDITASYPEFAQLGRAIVGDALLDGEIVALDGDGRPDFGLVQRRMHLKQPAEVARAAAEVPARLLLFDVLEIAGTSVIDLGYEDRRALLTQLLVPGTGVPVEIPEGAGDGASVAGALAEAKRLGLEGVVAKRRSSKYRPGARSDDWVKLKLTKTQSVVIGGYRAGSGTRAGMIRSLLVGIPDPDGLRYVGRVGSGFSEADLTRLLRQLRQSTRAEPSLTGVPSADAVDAVWVEPTLVGEIELAGWTRAGLARHPRWRGIRPDLSPTEVTLET
ncbi:MAG TPA: ATP-dependent DNA ligase [Candidatus Lumbricidophila sp.]|nr:ATP-dependent DNA ligase [Candidatus Lumbricidophila sp.]